MRRMPTSRRHLLSITSLALIAACGSDATGPLNANQNAFTNQEALTVASAIFTEISNALSTSGFSFSAAPAGAAARSAVPITGSATVNSPCTNGGSITGNYTYTQDVGQNGSGSASGTMSAVTHACKISTGTRVIAVDGQLTYTFDMFFSQNVSLNRFNWRGTGSFTWSGGNCSIDYTLSYTGAAGGSSSISGSVCGVNLNTGQRS